MHKGQLASHLQLPKRLYHYPLPISNLVQGSEDGSASGFARSGNSTPHLMHQDSFQASPHLLHQDSFQAMPRTGPGGRPPALDVLGGAIASAFQVPLIADWRNARSCNAFFPILGCVIDAMLRLSIKSRQHDERARSPSTKACRNHPGLLETCMQTRGLHLLPHAACIISNACLHEVSPLLQEPAL